MNEKQFLDRVHGGSIVIWGARMTGIGLARYAASKDIKVLCFVDSDPALHQHEILGIPVLDPKALAKIYEKETKPALVVAVSIKEAEIIESLRLMGLNDIEPIIYSNFSDTFYTVDIVGTCNLKCASCAHSIQNHGIPLGIMSFANLKKVVAKIKRESQLVTHMSLYSWGEPLLHPEIDKIIEHLHENNIAVALSSNLSIKFEDRIDKVIKKSPEYLKVSTSGYYPNAYNSTHAGGDVNLVKSNLYKIRYLIDKYQGKQNTLVDVNYHLYRDNNGVNLDKMRELCDELGFVLSTVHALVMPLERVINHCEGRSDSQTRKLNNNLLVDIDEGIRVSRSTIQSKSTSCPFRENQVNINSDLSVPVCCTVFNRGENIVAKNYLNVTPEDIKIGKTSVSTCKKCMAYGLPEYNMGFNKNEWERIARQKSSFDSGY